MKFKIYALATTGRYCGVIEADSKEEAEGRAEEVYAERTIGLCHHCANKCDEPNIHSFDIEPADDSEEADFEKLAERF